MRKYELLTIIKPNMDAEEADKVIAKIEESIKSLGGNVTAVDKMGEKNSLMTSKTSETATM